MLFILPSLILIKGGVKSKRYQPYVKTLNGKLIGNAHPEHHPNCHAVTREIRELQEMDRVCRARIRASNLSLGSSQKLVGSFCRSFCFNCSAITNFRLQFQSKVIV